MAEGERLMEDHDGIKDHPKPATPPAEAPAEAPAETAPEPAAEQPAPCTTAQVEQVKQLVAELKVDREKLVAILARVNVTKVSEMTAEQCGQLVASLEAAKAKQAAA